MIIEIENAAEYVRRVRAPDANASDICWSVVDYLDTVLSGGDPDYLDIAEVLESEAGRLRGLAAPESPKAHATE